MKKGVVIFYMLFMLSFVCADVIGDSVPIQIQTLDASGNIITGTFNLTINISTSSSCTAIIYSNTSTKTTDPRGIVSYNLENVNLSFDEQYWFCYYRDGVLKDTVKAARVPYAFRAKNVSLSGVGVDTNLNLEGYNITAAIGTFGVQISNYSLNVLGKVNITGDLYVNSVNITGSTGGSGVPTGAIMAFNSASCPTGWTLADGTSGTPDLRGIFLRGSGTSGVLKYANGSYFGIGYGIYQNDSFQNIVGSFDAFRSRITEPSGAFQADTASSGGGSTYSDALRYVHFNASLSTAEGGARTGAETRPAYYATIYCVKTAEDTPVSNTIWTTIGSIIQLNNQSMNFNVNNTLFVNSSSGYVGIGNGSTRGIFDVGRDGNIYLVSNPMVGTDQFVYLPGRIYLSPLSSSDNSYIEALRPDGSGSLGIVIRTSNAGVQVNAMKIDSTGNVGIGTTTPSQKLEVAGNVNVTKNLTVGEQIRVTGNANITNNLTVGGQLSVTGASRVKAKVMTLSIPPTTHTIITYGSNSEVYDNLGELNTSYQFNPKQAGYYLVIAHAVFTNLTCNPNAYLYYYVYVNGSTLDAPLGYVQFESSTAAVYRSFSGSAIVYLRAGDYMDVRAYHTCVYTSVLWPNENFNYLEIHRLS
jgi:hypothetical protein